MSDFIQKLFTTRQNYDNGNSRIGEKDRIWYDSNTNTFRIQLDDTPGGTIIGGAGLGSTVSEGPTPPNNPQAGWLWWDSNSGDLFVYYDGNWVPATSVPSTNIYIGVTPPNAESGKLWWNTFDGALYIYYDNTWVAATSIPGFTYTLPTASTSVLGGVKVDGTTITINNGVISSSGGGASVTEGATPPISPSAGNLWWDTTSGDLFIYYDSNWVMATSGIAPVNADWNATTGLAQILNKPTLFSGSYTDLTNKPTLFDGAYSSLSGTPTIPSNTNQLTNGAGFITTADLPSLTGYATETYVTTRGYLTAYTETDPVFTASDAAGITSTDISNWGTAYSWGNHADVGYLTTTDQILWLNPSPTPQTLWRNTVAVNSTGATISLISGLPGFGSQVTWTFDEDKIKFPDNTEQTTAFTGSIAYASVTGTPTLATVATSGSYADLSNRPTIPAAQIQSDWNQATNTALDYIKNKPTIPDITNIEDTLAATGEPMGHEDKDQSTISFDSASRTFTITPVAANFEVWVRGTKHAYTTAQTVTIPNTSGIYYIYFDSNGLGAQTDYFIWDQQAPTALVYYNAVTGLAPYFADERHGTTLDWQTHEYLHRTRGAVIANGFSVGTYTIGGAVQLDIGNGTFFDEDLQIDVTHSNTPTANTWQQDLQGPAQIPMFYLSGTGWVRDNPTGYLNKQGTSRPRYNTLSGGVWSVADIDANKYGTTFIVATNNLTYPIIAIMSQSSHANQGDAEALEFSDLVLTGFPVAEFRLLYKVVFKADSTHGTLTSVWDLRQLSATTPSAAIGSDHGLLSGLGDNDHPQYLLRTEAPTTVTVNGTAITLGSSGTVTAAAGTLTGTTLNSSVVTSSLTSVGTLTGVTSNAATAFIAGDAAISGVALQIPRDGGIRNLYNGFNTIYFDVSNGGTTHGGFQFRSSSAFTNVLTMSTTAFNVSTDAVVTARTPSFGRTAWNSAIDTELTIDDYRFRVSNSGGIYPQIISNISGQTKNSAWTCVAAISGQAIGQAGSTGNLVPNNAWVSLYTFAAMNSAGDTVTVTLQDKNLGRIYRVTFMRSDNGSTTGYNIIAERLL